MSKFALQYVNKNMSLDKQIVLFKNCVQHSGLIFGQNKNNKLAMAIWTNLLTRFNLSSKKDANLPGYSPKVNEKSVIHRINKTYQYRIKAEMDKWRQAIISAESPQRPDRRMLHALYREVILDAHLKTQLRIAHVTIQRAPFVVFRRNKESDDIKTLLDKKWFRDFLRFALDAEFFGQDLKSFV